jgi:hypothetical protein
MTGKLRHTRIRRLPYIGMALYVLFLVASPFEHHDLVCHLKTPQHCTTCASAQLGADPRPPLTVDACHLADAGRAVSFEILAESTLLAVQSTGRSPPSAV